TTLWLSSWLFNKNWVRVALEAALRANEDLQLDTSAINWSRVNFLTGLFFFITGIINIWVAFSFSTETWVQFKLFGMLALNAVGMVVLFGYLSKHIKVSK
ncbi:MAG: septation protein IspZ, partial [Gammaproteobacteria bacterium]